MTITFMGIDLAKNVFQLYGVDADGNAVKLEAGLKGGITCRAS